MDEFSPATLGCQTFGDDEEEEDAATFKWRREGAPFPESHGGEYTFVGAEYDLDNVTKEDAGHYFCTATSPKGSLNLAMSYDCAYGLILNGATYRRASPFEKIPSSPQAVPLLYNFLTQAELEGLSRPRPLLLLPL